MFVGSSTALSVNKQLLNFPCPDSQYILDKIKICVIFVTLSAVSQPFPQDPPSLYTFPTHSVSHSRMLWAVYMKHSKGSLGFHPQFWSQIQFFQFHLLQLRNVPTASLYKANLSHPHPLNVCDARMPHLRMLFVWHRGKGILGKWEKFTALLWSTWSTVRILICRMWECNHGY